MLVIISDLHLTDGTSGETIKEGAFRVFRSRLRDLAYDASWRLDGSYKPIEELDILLLGDILDVIRSTQWLAAKRGEPGYVRPWDDPHSELFIGKVRAINAEILKRNSTSLAVLRTLNDGETITIPPATAAGKPARVEWEPDTPGRVPVKVRLHYMVGNHDWFYHLPGPAYDAIRQSVVEAMGLSNSAQQPFPHDPTESPLLQTIYRQHRLFARHGDIFDPYNYEGDRNISSLGDAVVIDLLNRFSTEVMARLGEVLPQPCIDGLKEIDNVRPTLIAPVWVNAILQRTCKDQGYVRQVKQIWDHLVDEFIDLPFVRAHDSKTNPLDSVDKLEWVLKFSKGVSPQFASKVVTWIQDKLARGGSTSYQTGLTEAVFKDRTARYIVNGHTHHYEIVPLDTYYSNLRGKYANQMYFNSGTWRQVHELAKANPLEQEFIGHHVMTYLAFFKDDERRGRPFEAWSGALAPE
jgi:UDP-2,3-diacylglucosamine pyrophosphatase LpxH